MTLLQLKWLAAITIFLMTLITGLLSIRFTVRFRKQLEIGDAIANGIFIGAALFHLIPEAIESFKLEVNTYPYPETFILVASSYFLFWLLEKVFLRRERHARQQLHVGILVIILSIHAAVAGLTLGISQTLSLVSILFVAILAHKGFETFAFVMNVYRQVGRGFVLNMILLFFSLITPLGILLGLAGDQVFTIQFDNLMSASFSAVAAGTFLYIGTSHGKHLTHQHDSYQQYTRILATIAGVAAMAILGFWL